MAEPRPGVTLVTNDTNPETGLGRVTYRTFEALERLDRFPVRLAVLDKHAREVRVHENGEVERTAMVRFPEHRFGFFFRACRHVPRGELNVVTNQVLSYLPLQPMVVFVHDLFFRTEGLSWAFRFHGHWAYARIAKAVHILANSKATRQELHDVLGIPNEQVTVVPLGVDADQFRSARSRHEARKHLGLNADAPLLFHLSTETPRKNVPMILRALALLRERAGLEATTLIKAGNATRDVDRRAHVALVDELGLEDAVSWVGYVDEDDLPAYYRAADVVVFPSLQEGFGLPVLEAMAAGTPVVTSNVSALPEAAGDAAPTVDPHDPGAIADAIERILTNPDHAAELVERGHARVAEHTWARTGAAMADRLEALLEDQRQA